METLTRLSTLCAVLVLASTASAQPATGPVSVEYVNPQEFTDINVGFLRSRIDDNTHLRGLRRHLERRAAGYLEPGQTLHFSVTDVDLAGDHRMQSNPALSDVRMVTNLYPPRMTLSYTLKDAGGSVVRSGEASLRDLGFDVSSGGNVSDPLRYEKRMLDKWLRREFGGKTR